MLVLKNLLLLIVTGIIISFSSCGQTSLPSGAMNKTPNIVEVQILSLETAQDKYAVILEAKKDTSLKLVMIVAMNEAQELAVSIEKIKPSAPLPLDLLQEAITKFGYGVREIVIDSLVDSVYKAKIICTKKEEIIELNARPVDAASIATKFDCPIFVNKELLTHY